RAEARCLGVRYLQAGARPFALALPRARAVVDAFGQFLEHLRAELRDVVRLAAGDQALVDHYGFVTPLCARVLQVDAYAGPGGERTSRNHLGRNEQLRPVTDGEDRLAGVEEGTREAECAFVITQLVGSHHAARYQQGVELAGIGVVQALVDL